MEKTSTDIKRENRKINFAYHEQTLRNFGVGLERYFMKADYHPREITTDNIIYVGMFISEVSSEQDSFIEFSHADNSIKYPERALYRLKSNPHFDEEYLKLKTETSIRYMVPISELEKIVLQQKQPEEQKEEQKEPLRNKNESKQKAPEFILSNEGLDIPLNEMTLRDLAAILLKKPCSHKKWLNELIQA